MTELKTFIDFIQGIGFVGILIILAVPKARAMLGFEREHPSEDVIASALKKAFVDNDESPVLVKSRLGRICDDMSRLRKKQEEMAEDLSFIKGKLDT